ncbi:hypothetical protein SteCoe_34238 [Stentor coeruleus]|uniref:Major facilitator superfamily (MFS) profile domain-containing protein n=1 Tax=Stentor coeruleus TaxID=5963 RepID=A0A1R2AV70_9CILI|nr:hypothetical protein SteCoe_34238 [Stentor coeruleus]
MDTFNYDHQEKCIISDELGKIGWGKYQYLLFFNCLGGLSLAMVWIETTAIIMHLETFTALEGTLLAIFMNLGTTIGTFLLSWLVSRVGRAKVFKICTIIEFCGGVISLGGSYCLYLGLFFIGFGSGGDMSVAVTVFIEQIPLKYRRYTSVLNVSWCIGGALSSLFAFLISRFNFLSFEAWTIQMVICTLLSLLLTILRMKTLESPIFLYEMQNKKVYDVMLAIAKRNSQENYLAEFPLLRKETAVLDTKASIFSKNYIHTTLFLLVVYFFSSLAYYCLLYYMPVLIPIDSEETVYYIICLQQLLGIPGVIFTLLFMDGKFGRRGPQIYGFALSAIFVGVFILTYDIILIIFVSGIINAGMMAGLSSLYTQTQELYPPLLRGDISGWANADCFLAGALSPVLMQYLYDASTFWSLILIGTSFLISSLFAIGLRETRINKKKVLSS